MKELIKLKWHMLGLLLCMAIIVVSILLLIATQSEAGRYNGEYAGDYAQHYLIGGVIGGLVEYYYPPEWNQNYKWVAAIGLPMIIGGIHEVTDVNPSMLDVLEWGAGGALGKGAVCFMMTWKF